MAPSLDGGDDFEGVPGPDEWLRVMIGLGGEAVDGGLEVILPLSLRHQVFALPYACHCIPPKIQSTEDSEFRLLVESSESKT